MSEEREPGFLYNAIMTTKHDEFLLPMIMTPWFMVCVFGMSPKIFAKFSPFQMPLFVMSNVLFCVYCRYYDFSRQTNSFRLKEQMIAKWLMIATNVGMLVGLLRAMR